MVIQQNRDNGFYGRTFLVIWWESGLFPVPQYSILSAFGKFSGGKRQALLSNPPNMASTFLLGRGITEFESLGSSSPSEENYDADVCFNPKARLHNPVREFSIYNQLTSILEIRAA